MIELVFPQERRIALKENLLRSITQDEGGVLEGEPLDIDSYITDMERELERRSKNSQRKVGNQWHMRPVHLKSVHFGKKI